MERRTTWIGTPSALYGELLVARDPDVRNRPENERSMSERLKRLAPQLAGIRGLRLRWSRGDHCQIEMKRYRRAARETAPVKRELKVDDVLRAAAGATPNSHEDRRRLVLPGRTRPGRHRRGDEHDRGLGRSDPGRTFGDVALPTRVAPPQSGSPARPLSADVEIIETTRVGDPLLLDPHPRPRRTLLPSTPSRRSHQALDREESCWRPDRTLQSGSPRARVTRRSLT